MAHLMSATAVYLHTYFTLFKLIPLFVGVVRVVVILWMWRASKQYTER